MTCKFNLPPGVYKLKSDQSVFSLKKDPLVKGFYFLKRKFIEFGKFWSNIPDFDLFCEDLLKEGFDSVTFYLDNQNVIWILDSWVLEIDNDEPILMFSCRDQKIGKY